MSLPAKNSRPKDDTTSSKTSPSKRLKQYHSSTDTPGLDDKKQPKIVTTSDSGCSLLIPWSLSDVHNALIQC